MKGKRILALLALLFLLAGQPAAAAQEARAVVNGAALPEGSVLLRENTTYVALRALCEGEGMTVEWREGAALARREGLTIRAVPGQPYIEANGRYFYTGVQTPVRLLEGRTMVPLRALARAFDGTVEWDGQSRTAYAALSGAALPGEEFYSGEEVYWLSRIISAESQGEPLAGQLAVGNVVLNRVASEAFPNSIYEVIFDRENGVQFTPVAIGSIYWEPTEQSVIAAMLCLDGAVVTADGLYFQNGQLAQSAWVPEHCEYITSIGRHQFYR